MGIIFLATGEINKTLRSLKLTRNKIGSEGIAALAKNKNLRSLEFHGDNQKNTENVIVLSTNTFLRKLDLSYNQIFGVDNDILLSNTKLRSLKLRDNLIGNKETIALSANKSLRTLDLSSNIIGNEGAAALKALTANVSLRNLNLYANSVKNEGATFLIANKTLNRLDLSCAQVEASFIKKDDEVRMPIRAANLIINRLIIKLFWQFE